MKTRMKLLKLLLLIFIGLPFLAYACLYLARKHNTYKPNPVRPKDFPRILVAPEGAISLDYSAPSNSLRASRTYRISFIIDDPYPSEKTRNFMERHLRANGWQHLKYHLMNPDVPSEYPNVLLYKFYRDTNKLNEYTKEKCRAPKPKGRDWPLKWMEDWLSKNDERIDIFFEYVPFTDEKDVPDAEENVDLNRLYVNWTYFARDSWVRSHVLKYKELHPEEFSEDTK